MLKKVLALILAAGCIFVTACSSGTQTQSSGETASSQASSSASEESSSEEPLKIGAIYPLTGSVAAIGQNCKNGIDMAVDEVNAAGGVNGRMIEIVWGDSQGDPKIGMSEAERLITTGDIVALVGCYQSSVTEVVAQVAERYQMPFVSAISSSTALTTHGYQYFYRLALTNLISVNNMFKFATEASEKLGQDFKTCMVFTDNSILGQELVEGAREFAGEYGFEIVKEVIHNSNASDLSAEILTMMQTDADFIFADQYIADAILATNTMKELNYAPPIFISKATGYIDPTYIENTGANSNGMVTLTEFAPDSPRGIEVNNRFKERFGSDMNGHSCMTYTAIWLYKNIFEMALAADGEVTPAGVQNQLSTCRFEGAQFPDGTPFIVPYDAIEFTDAEINGVQHTNINMEAVPAFVQIQDGQYVSVWPWDVANADIDYPATYS